MKSLFLVCNAHLDPVWLWEWDEGAAAAISTFQTAAAFCEEYDGFVFCHNEALLYQWVQEYAPELFRQIQRLVTAGKWHIMGGWFLQPDCNMPSGESMLRQILTGRHYFQEYFQAAPKTAVSFDAFGHDRGLVQIMQQCGYDSYVFMRPEKEHLALPGRNFYWDGLDGSSILARRLDRSYRTMMGEAANDLERWATTEAEEDVSLFTWGVGNHGGGPSRHDWQEVNRWIEKHSEIACIHTTMEAFFAGLREESSDIPHVSGDLRPVNIGCYTSQARIKRLHCQLERELYLTEKLLSTASIQGLCEYPYKEFAAAERDLLISEFHDTLPGTTIAPVEAGVVHTLGHGLEIVSRLRMYGFMALLAGQPKAKEGELPLFLYNPHPYPVTGVFSCELMPAEQNWSTGFRNVTIVRQNGRIVPSQEEKEHCNINLDWRKRIVFRATLQPSGITRFDCTLEPRPCVKKNGLGPDAAIRVETQDMLVEINTATGLLEQYRVGERSFLRPGALASVILDDNADPWHMNAHHYGPEIGRFRLMTQEEAADYLHHPDEPLPAVRIVEDGPVRTVVEALFCWNRSVLVQTYRLPKQGTQVELEQRIFWNERDAIMKLEVPTLIADGRYLGQGMYSHSELPQDGTECASQRWCGMFGQEDGLTMVNSGTYGSHCMDGTIYISLLRAPAYSAHPIEDRPLLDTTRFVPRVDQGEHVYTFVLCGGKAAERLERIDMEAQQFNEAPYALNVFPSGLGQKPVPFLLISDPTVLVTAAYREPSQGKLVLRLWNPTASEKKVQVTSAAMAFTVQITIPAFRFQTYVINETQGLLLVEPVNLRQLA